MSGQFDGVANRVRDLAPVARDPLDSPYEISNQMFAALRHVLHDVGGQPDLPVPYLEKVEEDWEMNTYVTCECLGWRGVWNSEERRRAENDLGATLYFGLPYYARWATVAAKTLINKGLITPDELSAKLDEVRARLEARRDDATKFEIGDRVTVRDATSMFHTRTQAFTRGRTGVVVEYRPDWVIPEDEAWGRDTPSRRPDRAVLRRPLPADRPLAPLHRVRRRHAGDRGLRALARAGRGGGGHDERTITTTTRTPRSRPPTRSASSRSSRPRSANCRSRRACSRRRTTGVSPNGPTASGPPAGRNWSRRRGSTRNSRQRLLADGTEACKEVGIDWRDPTGAGTPSDYTYFYVLENTPAGPQRDRLHAVFVLPAARPRDVARLVPHPELPSPAGALAARGAGGVRLCTSRRTSKCACTTPIRSRASW